jgi:hypothetical protein
MAGWRIAVAIFGGGIMIALFMINENLSTLVKVMAQIREALEKIEERSEER